MQRSSGQAPTNRRSSHAEVFDSPREIPGVGELDPEALRRAAANSNAVLAAMGPGIQWVHSYVTGDALMCVYNARDEQQIREHARRGGIPCNQIVKVTGIIDPVTAEK